MANIFKQPSEIFPIGASIYGSAAATEAIVLATSTVTVTDVNGNDVSETILDQDTLELASDPEGGSNNMLVIKLRAGTATSSPYKVTFKMPTDVSNLFETDAVIVVKEE